MNKTIKTLFKSKVEIISKHRLIIWKILMATASTWAGLELSFKVDSFDSSQSDFVLYTFVVWTLVSSLPECIIWKNTPKETNYLGLMSNITSLLIMLSLFNGSNQNIILLIPLLSVGLWVVTTNPANTKLVVIKIIASVILTGAFVQLVKSARLE